MVGVKVKLYGTRLSPFSNRIEIALKLKGVEYEFIEEDLRNKSSDLLKYNPVHKKIPVLVHGNNVIVESQVILEYIDEAWDSGASIMPHNPHQRALARFWARFIDEKVFASVSKAFIRGEEPSIKEEVLENLKVLDKEMEGKKFWGGEDIGLVDIVGNFLGKYWLVAIEEATGKIMVNREAYPSIFKWRDEFEEYEVVKEVLPPREKLVGLFRARLDAVRAQQSQ